MQGPRPCVGKSGSFIVTCTTPVDGRTELCAFATDGTRRCFFSSFSPDPNTDGALQSLLARDDFSASTTPEGRLRVVARGVPDCEVHATTDAARVEQAHQLPMWLAERAAPPPPPAAASPPPPPRREWILATHSENGQLVIDRRDELQIASRIEGLEARWEYTMSSGRVYQILKKNVGFRWRGNLRCPWGVYKHSESVDWSTDEDYGVMCNLAGQATFRLRFLSPLTLKTRNLFRLFSSRLLW